MRFFLEIISLLIILTAIYNGKENQFFWFSFLIVFLSYCILYEILGFLEKRKTSIVIFKLDNKEAFELLKELKNKERMKNE